MPKNLKPGNYRIEEVTAPDGYTISKNYVTVAVDTDTAYLTDPVTGDAVIAVEYTNAPVKGQLKIYKQGEVLKGFDKDFQYEMAGLAGAEFEVYAAEDIYTADHQVDADGQRTLYFAKDALVATVTTDADGYATVKNLPLGRYYVKEKNAPDTHVLNTVPENVEFAYADQDTAVIEKKSLSQMNDRKCRLLSKNRMLRQGMQHRVMQRWKVQYMAFMQGKILFIRMEEPERSIRKTA